MNYDGAATLRSCIDSLRGGGGAPQIFVVDNASTDASDRVLAELERETSGVTVVRSDRNLGYAGAFNRVLDRCDGRYVGAVNVDVVAERAWLEPLVEFMDQHPEVGAVNPLIALHHGGAINAAGQDVHVTGLGFNRALNQPIDSVGKQPFAVTGIHGAAFLVRRELIEQTGGMDETGFLYHEDVNLSWLLRMMGWALYCVPDSVVRHDYVLTMHPEKLYLLERNRLAMTLAYLEPRTRLRLAPLLLLTEGLLWGYSIIGGPAFLRAKLRSYRWVVRRRAQIAARRELGDRVRTRGDRDVLRGMRWGYTWPQVLTLAREAGEMREPGSGRRPIRRPPPSRAPSAQR